MRHNTTSNRTAMLVAVVLTAAAVAVPTASACALDADDNCIVTPDRDKARTAAKPTTKTTRGKPSRTLVVSPDAHKTPPRAIPAPRGGR